MQGRLQLQWLFKILLACYISSTQNAPATRIVLPPDIHPLPGPVTPYFVYPFTIEPHIMTLESSGAPPWPRTPRVERHACTSARKSAASAPRRIAPGFEPGEGHLLASTKRSSVIAASPVVSPPPPKSVIEDLVD
ncbi:hypothetical protein C8J57DRAFT_319107 [Mycena rebaudengoi]|nr:hypothetical protein C8J57DRAFT_319107 [Mycena rebaudengoi]